MVAPLISAAAAIGKDNAPAACVDPAVSAVPLRSGCGVAA